MEILGHRQPDRVPMMRTGLIIGVGSHMELSIEAVYLELRSTSAFTPNQSSSLFYGHWP